MTRNGRNRTIGYYNLDLLPDDCLTANGMPIIWPCKTIPPDDLIGFNYAKGTATKQATRLGCHFYLDDYQFERCWQTPSNTDKCYPSSNAFSLLISAFTATCHYRCNAGTATGVDLSAWSGNGWACLLSRLRNGLAPTAMILRSTVCQVIPLSA